MEGHVFGLASFFLPFVAFPLASLLRFRDLKGVLEREKAALGLFISLQEPTRPMREEEASGGFYQSELWQRAYPKVQIRTIEELLAGHDFDLPPRQSAYQAASRVRRPEGEQTTLEQLAG